MCGGTLIPPYPDHTHDGRDHGSRRDTGDASPSPQLAAEGQDEEDAREDCAQLCAEVGDPESAADVSGHRDGRVPVAPGRHQADGQRRDGQHRRDAIQCCRHGLPLADGIFGFGEHSSHGTGTVCQEREHESEERALPCA